MPPPTIYYGTFLHHPSTKPSAYAVLEDRYIFVDEGGVIVGISSSSSPPEGGELEGLRKQYVTLLYILAHFLFLKPRWLAWVVYLGFHMGSWFGIRP